MAWIIRLLKTLWETYLKKQVFLDHDLVNEPAPYKPRQRVFVPEPVMLDTSKADLLEKMCQAIKVHEGWYKDSRSQRNNNPGNCKYSSVGYLAKYKKVKMDKDGFAIFETYELGWTYLQNLILEKAKRHPTWTLKQFFNEYAPPIENDTVRYSSLVAKAMDVSPFEWKIGNLL